MKVKIILLLLLVMTLFSTKDLKAEEIENGPSNNDLVDSNVINTEDINTIESDNNNSQIVTEEEILKADIDRAGQVTDFNPSVENAIESETNNTTNISNTETIIGLDSRQKVDVNQKPYESIVKIGVTLPNGNEGTGTGFLIDDDYVLTAGHNVSNILKGGRFPKLEIYAGYSDGVAKRGTANVIKAFEYDEWSKYQNSNYDMALLKIDKPLGKQLGKFNLVNQIKLNDLITTSGYPGDRDKTENQYVSTGRIKNITSNRFFYDNDTFGGQSGSPVWNSNKHVVGIHTNGFSEYDEIKLNSALRINEEKLNTINEWKQSLIVEDYNKLIFINNQSDHIWNNLDRVGKSILSSSKYGSVLKGENLYKLSNGDVFVSLVDMDNKLIGYINKQSIGEVTWKSSDLIVELNEKNTPVFKNLYGKRINDTKSYYTKVFQVKVIYTMGELGNYYSIYDKYNKWYGYVNKLNTKEIKFKNFNKFVKVDKNNYIIWGDFLGKQNSHSKNYINKILYAKEIYTVNNGWKYIKLYDKDNYIGFVNSVAIKELGGTVRSTNVINKSIEIISKNPIMYDESLTNHKTYSGKYFHAKEIINMTDGRQFYSLFDKNDNWVGFINTNATKEIVATSYNKKVKVVKSGYGLYRTFYGNKISDSKAILNNTYNTKYLYRFSNGYRYLSLYDSKNKWVGYLNINATKQI